MNILHLSNHYLNGAPQMLSDAVSAHTKNNSVLVQFSELTDQSVSRRSIQFGQDNADAAMLAKLVDWSDVLHIHDVIPSFALAVLAQTDLSQKKTVYQIHSTKFQPPIFGDLSAEMGIPFDHRLVTCHSHARQFPDFDVVPLCFDQPALSIERSAPDQKHIRVVTAQPSRQRSDLTVSDSRIELVSLPGGPPQNRILSRKHADISLDDGMFEQENLTRFEALACGNAVVTAADDLSLILFKTAYRVQEPPPFLQSKTRQFPSDLMALMFDRAALEQLKVLSQEYFHDVMAPQRVAGIFDDIYSEEIQDLAWTG